MSESGCGVDLSCPQASSIRHLFLRMSTSHRYAVICLFKRVGGHEVCLATPPPEKRQDTGIVDGRGRAVTVGALWERFNSLALYCNAAFQLE